VAKGLKSVPRLHRRQLGAIDERMFEPGRFDFAIVLRVDEPIKASHEKAFKNSLKAISAH
jgi:hypothetical protein